jgi:hypothetical protein
MKKSEIKQIIREEIIKILEVNYKDINLDNQTDIENEIDNFIQQIYWSGGDIERLYDEWKNLNLGGIEFDNKSIHFLNWLKHKFPKYSNIKKSISSESDVVIEINKLIQLIKDIEGPDEVERLYDEYESIDRPDNYEYHSEIDSINFLNWLKQKKKII